MPYFRFVRVADDPVDQVMARLSPQVAARSWLRWRRPDAEFEGVVSAKGFSLVKVVRGRDSFNPLIFGKVVALPSRTRITVQMWLHPLVVAFLAFLSYLMAPEAWRALRRLPGGDRGNVVAIVAIWSMAIVFFYVSARRIRAIVIK